MFKFNFFEPPNEIVDSQTNKEKKWQDAEKISCEYNSLTIEQQNFDVTVKKYGNIEIKNFTEGDVINYLKTKGTNCVLKAEFEHSDLITAEYEGGLKVWECTEGLIQYLEDEKIDFRNKKILDLGCGCGNLGIFCILRGALVDFQDYNKDVIENITVPNVILNVQKEQFDKCNFFSGDWKSLLNYLQNENYDYILTSETIYNPENYEKLIEIFIKKLKIDGVVYLGAKTYYFGVGGGTREFEGHLAKCGQLKSAISWKCTEGLQREIIKIKRT